MGARGRRGRIISKTEQLRAGRLTAGAPRRRIRLIALTIEFRQCRVGVLDLPAAPPFVLLPPVLLNPCVQFASLAESIGRRIEGYKHRYGNCKELENKSVHGKSIHGFSRRWT